jgi:hypothetical protein
MMILKFNPGHTEIFRNAPKMCAIDLFIRTVKLASFAHLGSDAMHIPSLRSEWCSWCQQDETVVTRES